MHSARARAVWELNLARVWNEAIEAAALVVCPVPHVDEERECSVVAEQVRALKRSYRPEKVEALIARRDALADKKKRTRAEESELRRLSKEVSGLPTARSPEEQETLDFFRETAEFFRQHPPIRGAA